MFKNKCTKEGTKIAVDDRLKIERNFNVFRLTRKRNCALDGFLGMDQNQWNGFVRTSLFPSTTIRQEFLKTTVLRRREYRRICFEERPNFSSNPGQRQQKKKKKIQPSDDSQRYRIAPQGRFSWKTKMHTRHSLTPSLCRVFKVLKFPRHGVDLREFDSPEVSPTSVK